MSSPANKPMRLSASRTSITGRKSLQGGQSSLPRPSNLSVTRLASTQPSYDFLGGGQAEEAPPPTKRTTLRHSIVHKPDSSHDEGLRAKINALEYELKNIHQERSLLVLQHEKELRDLQLRADADFKKYQTAESASKKATQRYDQLATELRDAQDQAINEKATLEKCLRDLQDQNGSLKEDVQDAQAQLSDQERHFKHQIDDVEAKRAALQETVDQIKSDFANLSQNFDASQSRLAQRDVEVESLKVRVEELKLHGQDSQELSVLQRELTSQVEHIRQLESTNREQLAELRRLRDTHRSVQVVEEQKRSLETELHVLQDVHRQLGEAQIQKEMLEDEKRTWSTLLEREGHAKEFDTPEAVVRALVNEGIEHASILDRLGNVETELTEKDEMIKTLEGQTATLTDELEKAKSAAIPVGEAGSDSKAYKRLDRQRTLAVKEVEYLRAQLKTFDTEETVLMDNHNFDAQRSQQVQQLEALVDQYKQEIQTLHTDLSQQESAQAQSTPAPEPRGTKRPASSQDPDPGTDTSQLGHLLRKNKNLQVALQKSTQQSQLLATDLQATKSQLKSLRASSQTRILSLRDNPTSQAESIKLSTLNILQAENTHLLSQLRGSDLQGIKVVPVSTVDALQLDLQDMQRSLADKEKRMRRQREIWTDKAAEFRESIASVLGYRVIFLPNGKVKVASTYHGPAHHDDDEDDGDVSENFILFDGEKGTMKISGGDGGAFEREIGELVEFWIRGRREIPCLLAAMTLEFYEKYRAGNGEKGEETHALSM